MFLCVNLIKRLDSKPVASLLQWKQEQLLQSLPGRVAACSEQTLSLIYRLFQISDGWATNDVGRLQHDSLYSVSGNMILCGQIFGIFSARLFERFGSQELYMTLFKSELFAQDFEITLKCIVK